MRSAPVRHISMAVGILAAISLSAGGFGCSKEPAAPQPVVKRQAPKPEAKAPAAQRRRRRRRRLRRSRFTTPAGDGIRSCRSYKAEESAANRVMRRCSRPCSGTTLGAEVRRRHLDENGRPGPCGGRRGKGVLRAVGTRIGRAGGVVSRITGKEILVKEEFVGNRGQKVVKESGIQLTTQEENNDDPVTAFGQSPLAALPPGDGGDGARLRDPRAGRDRRGACRPGRRAARRGFRRQDQGGDGIEVSLQHDDPGVGRRSDRELQLLQVERSVPDRGGRLGSGPGTAASEIPVGTPRSRW